LTLFFKQGNPLDRGSFAFRPSLADFVFLLVYSRASQRKGGKRILFQKGFFFKKKSCWGGKLLSSHGVMAVLNFDSVKLASDSV
jgi:hypothetical protein